MFDAVLRNGIMVSVQGLEIDEDGLIWYILTDGSTVMETEAIA